MLLPRLEVEDSGVTATLRMIQWRANHPDTTGSDQATDAVLDRIIDAYHAASEVFGDRAAQPAGIGL